MHMKTRWLLYVIPFGSLLLVLSACSEPPPGSGSIDGFDLGLKTELHLIDLQRVSGPSAAAVDRARALFASAPAGLDSVRVYTATAVVDEDEGAIPLKIWLMPLGNVGDGYLALAIDDDGRVRRSRIWGSPEIDADPEAAWENYWRQFEYENARSVIPPMSALNTGEVDSVWAVLASDTSTAAATTRLLYEHRLLMYENSFILRRTMSMARGSTVPPVDWLEENRNMYHRLEEIGMTLRPIIGDSASIKYVNVTREAGEILDRGLEHARASEGDELRERILTFRRRSCGGCHGIENHAAGEGKLKDAVFGRLDEFGVRRDLYSVGRDVWGVPGEDGRSQSIADAVKAILVVAGA